MRVAPKDIRAERHPRLGCTQLRAPRPKPGALSPRGLSAGRLGRMPNVTLVASPADSRGACSDTRGSARFYGARRPPSRACSSELRVQVCSPPSACFFRSRHDRASSSMAALSACCCYQRTSHCIDAPPHCCCVSDECLFVHKDVCLVFLDTLASSAATS